MTQHGCLINFYINIALQKGHPEKKKQQKKKKTIQLNPPRSLGDPTQVKYWEFFLEYPTTTGFQWGQEWPIHLHRKWWKWYGILKLGISNRDLTNM